MRRDRLIKKSISILSAAVVVSFAATASATVYPTDKRHLSGPLRICDQGSFFVGGVPKITQYANSVTPSSYRAHSSPRCMCSFRCPRMPAGGRSSWCTEAAIQGHVWSRLRTGGRVVLPLGAQRPRHHVVDQAGRGRSGFDRSFINESIATATWPGSEPGQYEQQRHLDRVVRFIVPSGSDIITGTMIQHGDPGDPTCASDPFHCAHTVQVIPPVPHSVDRASRRAVVP